MKRNEAGGAQDGLAQPAHPEQQKQRADDDLKRGQGNESQGRPDRRDEQCQQRDTRDRTNPSRTPATCDAHREHDRQRFDELDEGCEKGRQRGGEDDKRHRQRRSLLRTTRVRERRSCG